MSYRSTKIFVALFLAVYFLAGLYTSNLPNREAYPFFSWNLFSKVPQANVREFALRIVEYKGQRFDPPIFLNEAKGMYSRARLHKYWGPINSLGRNIKSNNKEEIERFRRRVENIFYSHPVTYEIVRIRYNSVERWKTGRLQQVETIAVFTTQAI